MSDWAVSYVYDSRFGSLMVQVGNGKAESPPFSIRLSDILRAVPDYEIRQLIEMSKQPKAEYIGIETARQQAINDLDCQGKVVLDIGGYDGWAAKRCLEKGAARAICLDNHQYEHYGWDEKKHAGIEYVQGDFMRLDTWGANRVALIKSADDVEFIDRPDVIIFYNVLYHLKNPWAGLDKVRQIIKPDGVMLLCSLFRYHDGAWVYVYESRECNKDDETVYFGPSVLAIERLLKHTGWDFERIGLQDDRVVYRCTPTPNWERKHQNS